MGMLRLNTSPSVQLPEEIQAQLQGFAYTGAVCILLVVLKLQFYVTRLSAFS